MTEHPGGPYATYFAAEKLEQEVGSFLLHATRVMCPSGPLASSSRPADRVVDKACPLDRTDPSPVVPLMLGQPASVAETRRPIKARGPANAPERCTPGFGGPDQCLGEAALSGGE